VLAGSGQLLTEGNPVNLRSGLLVWLPRRSRRQFVPGPGGLTYLTVHQRRPSPGLWPGSPPVRLPPWSPSPPRAARPSSVPRGSRADRWPRGCLRLTDLHGRLAALIHRAADLSAVVIHLQRLHRAEIGPLRWDNLVAGAERIGEFAGG